MTRGMRPRLMLTGLVTIALGVIVAVVGRALHFSGEAYLVALIVAGILISLTDPKRFGLR